MAQHARKRNRKSRTVKARRRRVVGLGGGAGAFLAFGMSPLAGAPPAHADEFDVIIEPIINSILGALATGLGALGAADVAGTSGVGAVDSVSVWPTDALPVLAPDPSAAVSGVDSWNTFTQGVEKDWITSSFGAQVDP